MKHFFFDCGTRDITASGGLLALRVLTGLMMLFGHGIPKIQKFGVLKEVFYVPDFLPQSWVTFSLLSCIAGEAGAALLVIIGFATRPAAFLLGFCMVVAAFGQMGGAPWLIASPNHSGTKEMALLYLVIMMAIILAGAGAYSLDAVIYRAKRRGYW